MSDPTNTPSGNPPQGERAVPAPEGWWPWLIMMLWMPFGWLFGRQAVRERSPIATSQPQNTEVDPSTLRRLRVSHFAQLQSSNTNLSSTDAEESAKRETTKPKQDVSINATSLTSLEPSTSISTATAASSDLQKAKKSNEPASEPVQSQTSPETAISSSSSQLSDSADSSASALSTSQVSSSSNLNTSETSPKIRIGPTLLRILGVHVLSPYESTSRFLATTRASNRIIVVFSYAKPEEGLQIFELDSLLLAVQETMSDQKNYFTYLLQVYDRLLSYETREFFPSVLRSLSLQIFLLCQEKPSFAWTLIQEIRQSCHVSDVYAGDSKIDTAHLEILLKHVAEHFSHLELSEVLFQSIQLLFADLSVHHSLEDDFYPSLRAMQALFSVQKIRKILLSHSNWHPISSPPHTPITMEETILGAILSISSANQMNLKFELPNIPNVPRNGPLARYSRSFDNIPFYQSRTALAHSSMIRIIDYLVQDDGGWKLFLDWLSKGIQATRIRPNSMGYDLQWIQSRDLQLMDGLYLNIMMVLLHLVEKYSSPFPLNMVEILMSIDMSFLEKNEFGFTFSDTTPLLEFNGASEIKFEDFISNPSPSAQSSSEAFKSIFIATLHYLQFAYMPVLQRYRHLQEQYAQGLRQDLTHHSPGGSHPNAAQLQQQLIMVSFKLASLHLSITPITTSTFSFFEKIGLWLQSLGFGSSNSSQKRYHSSIKRFPAFLIDSMVSYVQWNVRELKSLPLLPKSSQHYLSAQIVKSIMDVFACPEVTNYHIISRCIATINSFYTLKDHKDALMVSTPDPQAEINQLVLPMIKYYVKAEKTGSRMAYFEKFPVREQLGAILNLPAAKGKIIELCTNQELFKPFITVLLNDNLFLLDEALLKLTRLQELRSEQATLREITQPNNADIRAQNEIQTSIRETKQTLQSLSQFGSRFFAILESITALSLDSIVIAAKKQFKSGKWSTSSSTSISSKSAISFNTDYFTSPAILNPQLLDQLSVMLNYFLDHFASPNKRQKFFGDGNEEFFDIEKMIANLLLVYLNIHQSCILVSVMSGFDSQKTSEDGMEQDAFLRSLIRDERSYKLSIFENALKNACNRYLFFAPTSLESMRLEWKQKDEAEYEDALLSFAADLHRPLPAIPPEEVASFVIGKLRQFISALKVCEEKVREEDIPESDLPDQFLDALLATLMNDPVKLPSGNIVDRSTIIRQLEGHDKCDPFTRLPLTMDQVVSEVELKQEIQTWLAAKRRELAQARLAKRQNSESESSPSASSSAAPSSQ